MKQSDAPYGIGARSRRRQARPRHGAEGRHGGGAFKITGAAVRAAFIFKNHGEEMKKGS